MRVDKYIREQLLGPCLFFIGTLTGIIWVTQSLRSVDLIVNRGLSGTDFLMLTVLVLPAVLQVILPVALFAGILYTFFRFAQERELVAFWSAGLSPWQVALPALKVALAVTVLGFLLSLFLMPLGYTNFHIMRTSLQATLSHVLLQEGAFNTIGGSLTIYVRERMSSGELRGILVHDNREQQRPVTMMAGSGALLNTEEGPRLVLLDGNRQMVERETGQLSILYFDRYTLDLSQYAPEASQRWREPNERYIHELFWPSDSKDDQQHRDRLIGSGHERLLSPFYNLSFALIALVAMQIGEVQRRGQGWRVGVAIAVVLAVRLIGLGLANIAVREPATIPLLYLHVGLSVGLPAWLLADGRRRLLPRVGGAADEEAAARPT